MWAAAVEVVAPSLYAAHSEFYDSPLWPPPLASRKRCSFNGDEDSFSGHAASGYEGPPRKASRRSWGHFADVTSDEPRASFAGGQQKDSSWAAAAGSSFRGVGPDSPPPVTPLEPGCREEEVVAAQVLRSEVVRIRLCSGTDFRRVLDVPLEESRDLQAVQSRYRQFLLLLHPDKRSQVSETYAGGRVACDEALALVQRAFQTAKRELDTDPERPTSAQDGMRRMQEVQRERARQAMRRQKSAEVEALSADLEAALASSAATSAAPVASADATSQRIYDLLARMGAPKAG